MTFGTCSEFGFDFLRDRLEAGPSSSKTYKFHRFDSNARVQRELFYAIVDEADDTLIDDAGTPLLISMESLRQVMVNLTSNAVQAMGNDGGTNLVTVVGTDIYSWYVLRAS